MMLTIHAAALWLASNSAMGLFTDNVKMNKLVKYFHTNDIILIYIKNYTVQ